MALTVIGLRKIEAHSSVGALAIFIEIALAGYVLGANHKGSRVGLIKTAKRVLLRFDCKAIQIEPRNVML